MRLKTKRDRRRRRVMLVMAGVGGAFAAWLGKDRVPTKHLPAATLVAKRVAADSPSPSDLLPVQKKERVTVRPSRSQPADTADVTQRPAAPSPATTKRTADMASAEIASADIASADIASADIASADIASMEELLGRYAKDRNLIMQALSQLAGGQAVNTPERKRLAIVGELLAHALNRLPMQTVEGRKLQTRRVKAWLLSSRALLEPANIELAQSATAELTVN